MAGNLEKDMELGALLVDKGLIDEAALDTTLAQRQENESLQEALVRLELLSESKIVEFLGREFSIPTILNLEDSKVDPSVVRLLKEEKARRNCAIPLFRVEDKLIVAISDPLDISVVDSLQLDTGLEVNPLLSSISQIKKAIDNYYKAIDELTEKGEEAEEAEVNVFNLDLPLSKDEPEPVRIVNLLIKEAAREKCSDIHIEGHEDGVQARFREAGLLKDIKKFPRAYHAGIISRVKIMANLDIAEKRVPQDGRIQVRAAHKNIDLRVSCFPAVNGEKVVMRLLDRTSAMLGLPQLGFLPNVLEKIDSLIKQPYGMILITGPTGSGKSTTLYAALSRINSRDKNIITVEDPVEYRMKGVNQAQVNVKAGFTFALGLRSILRQDPDVIMVGEIRDKETAEISIHSALTGHLVFSTLHTNDAPGAITRLVDMGIQPFMVSASLIGVMAQRLVRMICPNCRRPYKMPEEIRKRLGLQMVKKELLLFEGKGCRACKASGYRGRCSINELMVVNEKIKNMIQQEKPEYDLREQARRDGMLLLQEDGIKKVLEGVTTLEEIFRVTTTTELER